MKWLIALFVLTTPLLQFSSCPLVSFFQPNTTRVRLVNNSDFNVNVVLFVGKEQNTIREVLRETGERIEFNIAPGQTADFSRDCDNLQAIVIDDADLMVLGSIGPGATTDVLRDGTNFGCGDTITFTFDHSVIITDFDIAISVAPG